MRVALFVTCFNDTMFPETGKAVVRLLERLGHRVEFPEEQTCCGQMHYNTGYQREAAALARRFVDVFAGYEAVVTPSGSCAGMVRELYPRLATGAGDRALAGRVADLAPRVFELSELLVRRLGVTDVGAYYPHRVTYHPTCHSLRLLRVGDAPLRLLRAVRGIDLVELPESQECCGFGGTFAVKNADTSMAMLSDKLRHVLDTRAEVCTAGDNSCLMQIGGALSRQRTGVRAVHLAEILATTEGGPARVTSPASPPERRAPAGDAHRGRPRTFPEAARLALADTQLRRNLGHATATIRRRRGEAVGELPDWEELREAGRAIKERVLRHLDTYLEQLEASVERAGGVVHWARDAAECNRIVADVVKAHGQTEVVKVNNGRSRVLADPVGRQTLNCIRCSACLNVCPVYERTGGHAYGSVYPGPIGAILTPQLEGLDRAGTLPYASSLCGACYEVCPVKIDIPEVLVHLRGQVVGHKRAARRVPDPEAATMEALAWVFADRRRYELAQKLARVGQLPLARSGRVRRLPAALAGWTEMRDAPAIPAQTFRDWWRRR